MRWGLAALLLLAGCGGSGTQPSAPVLSALPDGPYVLRMGASSIGCDLTGDPKPTFSGQIAVRLSWDATRGSGWIVVPSDSTAGNLQLRFHEYEPTPYYPFLCFVSPDGNICNGVDVDGLVTGSIQVTEALSISFGEALPVTRVAGEMTKNTGIYYRKPIAHGHFEGRSEWAQAGVGTFSCGLVTWELWDPS